MNPLAKELNDQLIKENPFVYEMLSKRGKELFFPKGILSQSAEAKAKAKKFNATIGIATEDGVAMHLPCIQKHLGTLKPNDAFPYAPTPGKPELRKKWQEKLLTDNPSLKGKTLSLPIVTSAITHGLSLTGDLFVDEGDIIILPDKLWGNYRLIFNTRLGSITKTFPLYNEKNRFNTDGFKKVIEETGKEKSKLIILLNFPNNPTGYSITPKEAEDISKTLKEASSKGLNLVVVSDDAYFGLFYEDDVMNESLFAHTANLHERILAVKLDGATKEQYVWGFRVGFITYGVGEKGNKEAIYNVLEKKTLGAIRGGISNSPHLSQTLVLRGLESEEFAKEKKEKYEVMKARALKVKEVLQNDKYKDAWTYYPFNSGYFMCLKLKTVNAETLRQHILNEFGIGVISVGDTDIRVAFSCIEVDDIKELFDLIYQGVKDLS
ncbi:MAG: aminotransferase class I/II-fold pyridoxal phosphate-dependent enzyme [Deltaproteobacteria bacterium]|nr:aminotransferase class I/II-fold pyridoxal phosphate-dependent enzyme [Deltaproteobacteria bacterium]